MNENPRIQEYQSITAKKVFENDNGDPEQRQQQRKKVNLPLKKNFYFTNLVIYSLHCEKKTLTIFSQCVVCFVCVHGFLNLK